jgi:hypothetical protein
LNPQAELVIPFHGSEKKAAKIVGTSGAPIEKAYSNVLTEQITEKFSETTEVVSIHLTASKRLQVTWQHLSGDRSTEQLGRKPPEKFSKRIVIGSGAAKHSIGRWVR